MGLTHIDAINHVKRNGLKSKKEYGIVIDNRGKIINSTKGNTHGVTLLDRTTKARIEEIKRQENS